MHNFLDLYRVCFRTEAKRGRAALYNVHCDGNVVVLPGS